MNTFTLYKINIKERMSFYFPFSKFCMKFKLFPQNVVNVKLIYTKDFKNF